MNCQDCVYYRCGRENHTYARDCPDFKLPERIYGDTPEEQEVLE